MDMLVKLYELKLDPALDQRMAETDFTIRRVLPPELYALTRWILPRFGEGCASEATVAMARQPPSCFIAVRDREIAGFACYDASAKGLFGPMGVEETMRGKGVGRALLRIALTDMHAQGYAYGVIGGAGTPEFYTRAVGAIAIAESEPGLYAELLPIEAQD